MEDLYVFHSITSQYIYLVIFRTFVLIKGMSKKSINENILQLIICLEIDFYLV